ncbi:MAG: ATP synthase F1 subunit epsilon [Myxococcales bacterium]|nr:ATP synthase F1 subunit epsilon [Myxococcota bacterium]MDW8280540.1 ATP synthase F1 subunit epsilon [Myxococcales bacterium]
MLTLCVLTPKGPVLEREVDEVTAPGVAGEFGVLEGHVPFLSASRTGMLVWRRGGERGRVVVAPGFVQVDGRGVTVLVGRAALAERVDRQEAEAQRQEAEGRLKSAPAGSPAEQLARADLEWAEALLSA